MGLCYNAGRYGRVDYPVALFLRFPHAIVFPSRPIRKTLLGILAAMLVACDRSAPSPSPPATVPPGVTPSPSVEPTPTEAVVALHLWLPESLAPTGRGEGARVLTQLLDDFAARHADVTLSVSAKKDFGPGGLLDLLRTAGPIAPTALPDAIMLSDADLAVAARDGLIQPLDELLNVESEADLFDFARAAARIDGKRMGLPLVADVNHLVFVPDRFDAPPTDWTDVISGATALPFAFADGAFVSDVVLADYQRLGGTIISGEGQPALTLDALTQLLALYRDARAADVIAAANLDWTSANAAWDAFRLSDAPLTIARASRYLAARAEGVDLRYARVPAIEDSPAPPIGRTWNLAIVTRDPRRQALAVELIEHLSGAENAAAWTQAEHVLPTSTSALALWQPGSGYVSFVRGELSRAAPPPSPAALEAVSPAFLNAIRDVLAGRATPQVAAAAAVELVARGGR